MNLRTLFTAALLAASAFAPVANAQYANHGGVMLQGFYWDSYTDTKWANITSQADELSKYFNLIWIPNSARDSQGGGNSMGYLPVYWFSNYNTCFGTEAELRNMIQTYKAKNVGFVADVVVNHRCGVSNWTNFPTESWRGTTYKLGPEHICCDDEVANQSGQAKPTGAADTGEGYSGARDLDHTSTTVQDNIKAYEKFLLEDLGYVGFRYDYCKGFASKYIQTYNSYSQPSFSVGEYWDGSYDVLANWINGTGKTSAAFDFAFKYAVNNAFSSNDLTKLVWQANGNTPQPAGLIHYGYPQYAVTFIDNHDTYRDSNKFTGDVMAANAFMLCSPGTPCVFLAHWKAYKKQLKPIIAARNYAGITNTSSVKVLKSSASVYLAEITGTNGKLAVRIGSTSDVPSGYDNSKLVASGDKYAVWSTNGKTGIPDDDTTGTVIEGDLVVYFRDTTSTWTQLYTYAWDAGNGYAQICGAWPGTKMTQEEIDGKTYWKYNFGAVGSSLISPMIIFNNGQGGTGNQTADLDLVNHRVYCMSGMTSETIGGSSDDKGTDLYLVGTLTGWQTLDDYKFTYTGSNIYTFYIDNLDGQFKIKDADANWKGVNLGGDTGGEDVPTVGAVEGANTLYQNSSVNLVADNLQKVLLTLTYSPSSSSAKLHITTNATVNDINVDKQDTSIEYYNLQGVRVTNPTPGIYIARQGSRVSKVQIR